jgi:mRNA interferase RelE/StbE
VNSLKARFTPESARLVSKLHPDAKKRVKEAIEQIREEPFSGHELQGDLSGFRSYKSKRYRIVYRVNESEKTIEVYHVGHRRDVYEQFRRLLARIT